MKSREKSKVNKIKVQERIWEIIIKWTNCDILSIDKKSKKSEYIYISLLFDKLEHASGSRGGLGGHSGTGPPLHYTPGPDPERLLWFHIYPWDRWTKDENYATIKLNSHCTSIQRVYLVGSRSRVEKNKVKAVSWLRDCLHIGTQSSCIRA